MQPTNDHSTSLWAEEHTPFINFEMTDTQREEDLETVDVTVWYNENLGGKGVVLTYHDAGIFLDLSERPCVVPRSNRPKRGGETIE